MAIADSRTFRSGNGEVERLPRNVAFGREVELTIVRSGNELTIYPARICWNTNVTIHFRDGELPSW